MTISTDAIVAGPYTGNGVTSAFAFAFKVFADTDVLVKHTTTAGVDSTAVLTTNYSVSRNADQDANPGGTITYKVAGVTTALPVDEKLTITSQVPATQATALPTGGSYAAKTVERMIDKVTILVKQFGRSVVRSIRQPITDTTLMNELPNAADRANMFLAFDASGHPIVAEEVTGAPATAFMQTVLDDATSNAALTTLTATRSETGAVAVPLLTKFKEGPSLFDFIPPNLHAGILARTNTTNLDTYIQAAIDALASGEKLLAYAGDYRLGATLTIQGLVHIAAAGAGRVLQPAVTAPVSFLWYGGASTMVAFGNQVAVKAGGGLRGIRLDGRAIATRCLLIKDHQHGRFDDLVLTGAITHAIEMTNTDALDPTGFAVFDNLQIALRGGGTDSANGIYLNGVGTGAAGVTVNTFRGPRIEHANGHGLILGLRADGNVFHNYFSFRANTTETGYGIKYDSANVAAVNTSNIFLGNTFATGGIWIEPPSTGGSVLGMMGTDFEHANATELASDLADRFNPLLGPGKNFVQGRTDKGLRLGTSRVMHEYQGHSYDAMRFVSFDGTGLFQYNNDMIWKVVRNGAGGAITSGGQPGGAIALTTDAASGDDLAIYSAADFTSGITLASNPIMVFDATPVGTITTMRTQFGMFSDATLPDPAGGVYVQYDPAVHANFECVARSAGASTKITTSIAGAVAKRQWMICLDDSQNVYFFTKLPTATQWTYLGVCATNVPTVALTPGFRVETNTTAARAAHVYKCEFGHQHE